MITNSVSKTAVVVGEAANKANLLSNSSRNPLGGLNTIFAGFSRSRTKKPTGCDGCNDKKTAGREIVLQKAVVITGPMINIFTDPDEKSSFVKAAAEFINRSEAITPSNCMAVVSRLNNFCNVACGIDPMIVVKLLDDGTLVACRKNEIDFTVADVKLPTYDPSTAAKTSGTNVSTKSIHIHLGETTDEILDNVITALTPAAQDIAKIAIEDKAILEGAKDQMDSEAASA